MRYEVLTSVNIEIIVLCCGMPGHLEDKVPTFRRTRLHPYYNMKLEAASARLHGFTLGKAILLIL
jgi:hypothetical protein